MTQNVIIPMIGTKTQKRAAQSAAKTNLTGLYLGACIGAAGGFLAGIVGLTLKAVAWFETGTTASQSVDWAATALIVAMFPLFALGAHYLDKIEKTEKAQRIEHCRRHSLSDEECAQIKDK